MEEKIEKQHLSTLDKYKVKEYAGEHQQNIPYEDYAFLSRLIDLMVRCDSKKGYDHVNVIWYLQSELSEKIGISSKKIRRGLKRLEELGYLFRIQTYGLENRLITILKYPNWTREFALHCAKRSLSIWAKFKNHIAISAVTNALRKLGSNNQPTPIKSRCIYEEANLTASEAVEIEVLEKEESEHFFLDTSLNPTVKTSNLSGGGKPHNKPKIKQKTPTSIDWEIESLHGFIKSAVLRLNLPYSDRQCDDLAELHLEYYNDSRRLREEIYNKLDRPTLNPDSILRYARSDIREIAHKDGVTVPVIPTEHQTTTHLQVEHPIPDVSTRNLWEDVKMKLKTVVNAETYSAWFDEIVPLKMDSLSTVLMLSDQFIVDHVSKKYLDVLEYATGSDNVRLMTFEQGANVP